MSGWVLLLVVMGLMAWAFMCGMYVATMLQLVDRWIDRRRKAALRRAGDAS